jgi:putative salt-induced outer membrane protein YdiY
MKAMMMTVVCLVAVSVLAQEKVAPVWATSASAGANLARGNTKSTLLNGGIISEAKSGNNEARVGVEANFGETEIVGTNGVKAMDTNVQNLRGFAEYRRLWDERDYGYLNGEIRNDQIADIDYRLMVGPGVGRYFIKSDQQKCSGEIGATYIQEKLAGVEDDTVALRLAQRYEVKVGTGGKLYEAVEYLPSLDDFATFLLNAEAGAEAMMSDRMSLRLAVQDKYNSDPAPGKKENDFILIGGLTVKL